MIETRPNAEAIAERSLRLLGFEPLVIRYNKLLKGARYEGARRVRQHGKDSLVERPFIPGYLFLPLEYGDDAMLADTDHGWGKPRGVRRVLRNRIGEDGRARPKIIRASIVDGIMAAALERDETPRQARRDLREAIDQYDEAEKKRDGSGLLTDAERAALERGPVRVRHPLGFEATLLSLDEQGRARYVAQLFGGEISGTVEDTSELELV